MKNLIIKIDNIEYKPKVYKKTDSMKCQTCDLKQYCIELRRHICSTFYPYRTDMQFKIVK